MAKCFMDRASRATPGLSGKRQEGHEQGSLAITSLRGYISVSTVSLPRPSQS